MKRSVWAGLACVAVVHGGAAAQPGPSDALAREIAEIAYKPENGRAAFVESFVRSFGEGLAKDPQVAAMFSARPDVREVALATARQAAGEQYAAVVLPTLIRSVASVYAANFAPAELVELRAYYRTPEAQRALRSFTSTAGAAEVAAARSAPVVVRFLGSVVGRKERALNETLATSMTKGMISAAPKVNEAVLPKVRKAVQAAMARQSRPR